MSQTFEVLNYLKQQLFYEYDDNAKIANFVKQTKTN